MRPYGPGDLLAGRAAMIVKISCVVKGALSVLSCSCVNLGRSISSKSASISCVEGCVVVGSSFRLYNVL